MNGSRAIAQRQERLGLVAIGGKCATGNRAKHQAANQASHDRAAIVMTAIAPVGLGICGKHGKPCRESSDGQKGDAGIPGSQAAVSHCANAGKDGLVTKQPTGQGEDPV